MSDTHTEQIGTFAFTVAFREPASEARPRAEQRAETLAAWLLDQWRKHREEGQHGDASDN
jgi:hypothetical protein